MGRLTQPLTWPGETCLGHSSQARTDQARPGRAEPSQAWPGSTNALSHTFCQASCRVYASHDDALINLRRQLAGMSRLHGFKFARPEHDEPTIVPAKGRLPRIIWNHMCLAQLLT